MTQRRRRGLVARLVVVLCAILPLLTACITDPLQVGSTGDPSAAALRDDGPQTAVVAADPAPITSNPTAGPQADRIIAIDLNGTLGSIVYALGLGSHMVGRDISTNFPAANHLPLITGSGHTVSTERVLAQRPTIVLAGADTNPSAVLDQLRAANVQVVEFDPERSVQTTPKLIEQVAHALGADDAGRQLAERTRTETSEAIAKLTKPTGDPVIAFLYIRGPSLILLAGPDSGADNLIETLGARDAGTTAGLTGAFTMVSAETMMRAAPEVILVMTQGAETVGGVDAVLKLPAVAATPAGRARRIVSMDEYQVLNFGPNVGQILAALGKAIYR